MGMARWIGPQDRQFFFDGACILASRMEPRRLLANDLGIGSGIDKQLSDAV